MSRTMFARSAMRSAFVTAEQRELRDLVRTIARERIAPRAADIDELHEEPGLR